MEKISVDLENCYGIPKFKREFDFSLSRAIGIYAPNGAMKTSFAKTFQDLQYGRKSKDLIYPARIPKREITKEDGSPLIDAEVFVIKPYNDSFRSDKISTLLVNKELKTKYEEIFRAVSEKKEDLLKVLKTSSGMKKDEIEKEISLTFTSEHNEEEDFFRSLSRLEKEVDDGQEPQFGDIVYTQIFNPKVEVALKEEGVREKIQQYIKTYEELISKSRYFKEGVFNHTNASTIAKSLTDNGFFEADHSVFLHSKEGDNKIDTKEELERIIEEEKQSILNNPALKDAFEEVDKKLSANAEVKLFRNYLAKNLKVLPELGGKKSNGLRQRIWISYFKVHKDLYKALVSEYDASKPELEKVIKQASVEASKWTKVVKQYNERFIVPFELRVENQPDVILNAQVPKIVFVFKDPKGEVAVIDEKDLQDSLSTGELRALYILNILFEIEGRINNNQPTLFIVDDIADSFDYKNKYAIVEYLKEISLRPLFRQIILTHNFDFFRTVARKFIDRRCCFTVEKSIEEITLTDAEYVYDPFKTWMQQLESNRTQLIASIAFVRNLIQYTKGYEHEDYKTLTSLLHMKPDTENILISDLQRIYNETLNRAFVLSNPTEKVYEVIFNLLGDCMASTEVVKLENKILLSIAIRLKTEKFILSKVADKTIPSTRQTQYLIDQYKTEFLEKEGEEEKIAILDEVDLMTAENIHLNSFMYEPILDMSDESLKKLCRKVDTLT